MPKDYGSARNDVFKNFGKQQIYIATGFFGLWDPSIWLLLWHMVFSLFLFIVSSLYTHTHTHTDIHSLIYSQNWTGGECASSTANETHPNRVSTSQVFPWPVHLYCTL